MDVGASKWRRFSARRINSCAPVCVCQLVPGHPRSVRLSQWAGQACSTCPEGRGCPSVHQFLLGGALGWRRRLFSWPRRKSLRGASSTIRPIQVLGACSSEYGVHLLLQGLCSKKFWPCQQDASAQLFGRRADACCLQGRTHEGHKCRRKGRRWQRVNWVCGGVIGVGPYVPGTGTSLSTAGLVDRLVPPRR